MKLDTCATAAPASSFIQKQQEQLPFGSKIIPHSKLRLVNPNTQSQSGNEVVKPKKVVKFSLGTSRGSFVSKRRESQ